MCWRQAGTSVRSSLHHARYQPAIPCTQGTQYVGRVLAASMPMALLQCSFGCPPSILASFTVCQGTALAAAPSCIDIGVHLHACLSSRVCCVLNAVPCQVAPCRLHAGVVCVTMHAVLLLCTSHACCALGASGVHGVIDPSGSTWRRGQVGCMYTHRQCEVLHAHINSAQRMHA